MVCEIVLMYSIRNTHVNSGQDTIRKFGSYITRRDDLLFVKLFNISTMSAWLCFVFFRRTERPVFADPGRRGRGA